MGVLIAITSVIIILHMVVFYACCVAAGKADEMSEEEIWEEDSWL